MYKLAIIPLILAAYFAAPGSHMTGGSHGGHPGKFLSPQALKELSLTEEQQTKIKALKDTHTDKMLDIRQKIERSALELAKLMDEKDPNQTKIEGKVREIGTLRTDMQLERIDFFFQVRKLLTAAQIEKLGTMRPPVTPSSPVTPVTPVRNEEGPRGETRPRQG